MGKGKGMVDTIEDDEFGMLRVALHETVVLLGQFEFTRFRHRGDVFGIDWKEEIRILIVMLRGLLGYM